MPDTHVFVLAGQSNMAGRGRPVATDQLQDPSLSVYSSVLCQWIPARHPLHADKPDKAAMGPGLAFARHIREHTGDAVGLIPCAFGGSEIARWLEGGDLFVGCVHKVDSAMACAPRGARLAGILWHQGAV